MNNETTNVENPIGLYKDPASGKEVGAIDPIQADAYVRLGFKLVAEGRDAAMKTQEDMDKDAKPAVESNTEDKASDKKGK